LVNLHIIMVAPRLVPTVSRSALRVAKANKSLFGRRSMASAAAATGTVRYVTIFLLNRSTLFNHQLHHLRLQSNLMLCLFWIFRLSMLQFLYMLRCSMLVFRKPFFFFHFLRKSRNCRKGQSWLLIGQPIRTFPSYYSFFFDDWKRLQQQNLSSPNSQ
jgi:hypothetical protein